MGFSTVPALMALAEQREAEQAEAEAWKVAQLAATLCAGVPFNGATDSWQYAVMGARNLLAESRRQAAAPAGEVGP